MGGYWKRRRTKPTTTRNHKLLQCRTKTRRQRISMAAPFWFGMTTQACGAGGGVTQGSGRGGEREALPSSPWTGPWLGRRRTRIAAAPSSDPRRTAAPAIGLRRGAPPPLNPSSPQNRNGVGRRQPWRQLPRLVQSRLCGNFSLNFRFNIFLELAAIPAAISEVQKMPKNKSARFCLFPAKFSTGFFKPPFC